MSKGSVHQKLSKVADPFNVGGKIAGVFTGDDGGKSRDPFRITKEGQAELDQKRLDEENAIRRKVIADMNTRQSLLYSEDKKFGG